MEEKYSSEEKEYINKLLDKMKPHPDPLSSRILIDLGFFKDHTDLAGKRSTHWIKSHKKGRFRYYFKKDIVDYLIRFRRNPHILERMAVKEANKRYSGK